MGDAKRRVAGLVAGTVASALLAGCAWVERSSVRSDPPPPRVQGNAASTQPSLSQTGRYVAFTSAATNLVAGDTNTVADVFVRDHLTDTTERVSVASDGGQADGPSGTAAISDDGRFVAFSTLATNLAAGDADSVRDVVVRDRTLGTTMLVSVAPDGSPVTDEALAPLISGDGRFVGFTVNASFGTFCCVPVGPYVRDLAGATTTQMPSSGFLLSGHASLADDGSLIAYGVVEPPFDPTSETAPFHAVVADVGMATVVETIASGMLVLDFPSYFDLALSGDGTEVAFLLGSSTASMLFRYDLDAPALVPLVDDLPAAAVVAISDDGEVIAVRTTPSGSESRYVVTDLAGSPPTTVSADALWRPVPTVGGTDLSGDGRWVAFDSASNALVGGDTNGTTDVFVRSVHPAAEGPS